MGIIITALLLGGCASQQAATPVAAPRAATALAFDPPILRGQQRMDLSREDRQPSAFVGYDSVTTSSFETATCNVQGTDGGSSGYVRESVTDKSGSTTR